MNSPVDQIEIRPCGPVQGTIRPPGSKSITNRALVCAALAEGTSRLTGVLHSEDTAVMIDCLQRLGIEVAAGSAPDELIVAGCGGQIPRDRADLYVANSGTTIRFLTALTCLGNGTYRLDGVPRMRERPIADLLSALNQLGADAQAELGTGCPPVLVNAHGLSGGPVQVRGDISSQFLSGLMMAVPYAHQDVEIQVISQLVSQPYVHMTVELMRAFGGEVELTEPGFQRFLVRAPRVYRGREYAIEPDASAASYFWGTAAVTGGRVTVLGLDRQALQGDVEFCQCLASMGCTVDYGQNQITVTGGPLRGIDVDMNGISDTVQTLAAVAIFAEGPTRVRGVEHIRHKETDRIGDLAREIRRLGAHVDEHHDGLTIHPRPLHGATLHTYNDHRMAMSLALTGLRIPGVVIRDPGCTHKTYPNFFTDLARLVGKA